jgi:hypothetical protein
MNGMMRWMERGLEPSAMKMPTAKCACAVGPVVLGLVVLAGASALPAQQAAVQDAHQASSLHDGFLNPPASARPRVWWHWMNGNISKEGIKLDLEWMHRVGIAGFQNFDAALIHAAGGESSGWHT